MWNVGWRDRVWSELNQAWDILIIGGGITGAGIFREAVLAGLRALLIDKGDFASGTSSRSSKMVHGGLRYLRNGQLRTTVSSVSERQRLLKEGGGLVTPQAFLFANFEGDRIPLWLIGLGLTVYDLLGLKWGHKRYGRKGMLKLSPHLNADRLKGGYRFFDAQTDDARLVLRVIREGVRAGGTALNYARAVKLLVSQGGQVVGAAVSDQAPDHFGRTAEVKAALVINASGCSADAIRGQTGALPRLRFLRGSHLVFEGSRFPLFRAVSFSHPHDQRPVMAVPWEGVTLLGTTDIEHEEPLDQEPCISSAEVDYLMVASEFAFPSLELTRDDILTTFSGIRSVEDTGKANPSKESREHVVWRDNGLLTVSGGKLTTFRIMARDALRSVRRNLPGNPEFRSQRVLDKPAEVPGDVPLGASDKIRLAGRYGGEALDLITQAQPGELEPIDAEGSCRPLWAELRWAARSEGVVHLDDLLLRRLRLGIQLPKGGIPLLDKIRAVTQDELGWHDEQWDMEAQAYRDLWHSCYSVPKVKGD